MAAHRTYLSQICPPLDKRVEVAKQRERSLSRMVVTYISTGIVFMLLPGTFLGVWNLIWISRRQASNSVSPAWIQAHGLAQVFGWIGTFILGIGFYSIPKMRRAQPFAMWKAWACWAMWTAGVAMRWISAVYSLQWRSLLPISASLELLSFAIFLSAVSSHRPARNGEINPKFERWILVVIAGMLGLVAVLITNLVGSITISLHGSSPAFGTGFDQRFLVLMAWGFMVPFVWGFSARWLSTFVGLRAVGERGLMAMLSLNTTGILLAMFGLIRIAVLLFLAASVMSLLVIRVAFPAVQPAKVQGIHGSFPYFVRSAYGWLIVAAVLGVWGAFAQHSDGIWGASRHALTVGFVSMMVFAIGQRILPAFSGMRLLYSRKLMATSLFLLTIGCFLRVTGEVAAYQGIAQSAWRWLPISAVIELTAVTAFAANLIVTLLSAPPSRLVQIRA